MDISYSAKQNKKKDIDGTKISPRGASFSYPAHVYGQSAYDRETREDEEDLKLLASFLEMRGFYVEIALGFGEAPRELIRLVVESAIDVLVMAGHGHRGMEDLFFGSTITAVRHEVEIPILVVRRKGENETGDPGVA